MSREAVRSPEAQETGSADVVDLGAGPGFERFIELVPDAIVLVGDDGRIAAVNAQAERLFGYPKGELAGEMLEVLIPEPRRKHHPAHREAYFAEPRKRPMGLGLELAGRRKDGSEFPADISLSAIETPNGLVAAAAVRDVSERVEADSERQALETEAREARDQQARRLESIGQLAGGIAHDFNNLLAVILSNAEMALEKVSEGTEIPEELAEIHGAAEHAAALTRQLLVFSRREVTTRERVDLSAIVRNIQGLLQRSIGENIDLEVRLSHELPKVMADPSEMAQVLLNLAINARDAMPSGGRLGIETSVVELDEEYTRRRPDVDPGRYVRLTVADHGSGMSPEVVSRAFEPFFTTKPKGEGTGLGLAIVYGIVKSAGGHVNIYSEEGEGTVIRVHIPQAEAGAYDEPEAAADTVLRGGGQTVLVVEDAERVRRTVTKVLERGGYRVLAANGGSEALAIFRKHEDEIDLLLTDIVMAGMPGTEIAKELRQMRPGLPVLYMSGYADVAAPIEEEVEMIEKPFTTADLLSRVASELAPSRTRTESHRADDFVSERILIVDDEAAVRKIMMRILGAAGYECIAAASVREAHDLLQRQKVDLAICDLKMPGESGMVLVGEIESEHGGTAILMVTGEDDPAVARAAIEHGANGYLVKPFSRNELLIGADHALYQARRRREERRESDRLRSDADRRIEEIRSQFLEGVDAGDLADSRDAELMIRLSEVVGKRDLETGAHIRRIGEYGELLAAAAGHDDLEVRRIRLAAPMHDVGKVAVPDAILLKPGALEPGEREVMQRHAKVGHDILSGSESELLELAATIALTHHERYDGGGYPMGLSAGEIPFTGRIVAIADVFDALTSDRPYRGALPLEQALTIMHEGRGTHFDPDLHDLFIANIDEVLTIADRVTDSADG